MITFGEAGGPFGGQGVEAGGCLEVARAFAQVRFDGTRVSGSGGCNRISGGYLREGGSLRIGPLAATRMACVDAERGQLESAFVDALQATTAYSLLGGNQLTLLDASGRTLAVLENR